ncbi:hypothetical protein GCM10009677_42650 [Sphaerisporangium rubeum]|uniref:Uncharacterized protein n=1 Tax=Sphaerisporangium rubeum TaxID=321317 RepID=A0A7X0ICM3_9ACTN|nr:hypothetical protein [Sphaerisporangium rubeum]MBB6471508.1 hypothetical protein [Sphaerisporangium rubeum]
MDEFAGVEPAGLQELAHRLKRLHSLLAEHGPMIQRNMRRWDSTLSFAAFPHLLDEALRDARDMAARATRAHALAGHLTTADGPPASSAVPATVRLDWEATGHAGERAGQDAETLARLAGGEDTAAGAPAAEDGAAARLHEDLVRGDAAYLAAFWGQACPIALQAVRTLARRAGPRLFGPADVALLRALGGSLASVTRMRRGNGADARPLLPDAALDEITKHPDQWSVATLVRYGPDGRDWDGDILAVITRAVLEAHSTGRVEPPEQARGADLDPVAAVLRRAAENGHAARILLGDPATCPEHAALLRDAVARVSAGEHLDDAGEGELEQRGGDQA